jgi:hypothetical protein
MRVSTNELRQKIARVYPKTTSYRYVYNGTVERTKMQRVKVYFLLFDPARGHGVDDFVFYLRNGLTPSAWADYLRERGIAAYATRWIPTLNAKRDKGWRVTKVLCFHKIGRGTGRRQGSNI